MYWEEDFRPLRKEEDFSLEHRVIEALSPLYVRLRELQIWHLRTVWKRDGQIWKRCSTDAKYR